MEKQVQIIDNIVDMEREFGVVMDNPITTGVKMLMQNEKPDGSRVQLILWLLSSLPDYQKRAICEKLELDGRIERLRSYLGSPHSHVNDQELDRLDSQLEAMCNYSRILSDRIESW